MLKLAYIYAVINHLPSTPMQTSASESQTSAPLAFSMTPSAEARIAYLLSDEPQGTWFWVRVDGGGCSGFQYLFDMNATAPAPEDFTISRAGAKLAVDEVSLPLLSGSTLDYVEDLASAGFEIKNPNATAKCGCGNSFSVSF